MRQPSGLTTLRNCGACGTENDGYKDWLFFQLTFQIVVGETLNYENQYNSLFLFPF
jgi:hypothetical protein